MTTQLNRADIEAWCANAPEGYRAKIIRFVEELFVTATNAANDASGAVASTGAIQDATVITLSPNAAFNNERVLIEGSGITFTDGGNTLTISAGGDITTVGGFALVFNLPSDSTLNLRATGTIPSSSDGPYADDTAAAAAGIQVNEWYAKTDGTVVWRQV
ncbi:hypothetical protein FPZ24_08145 [Sphingomonas panacisoli]|uniref:Uncharacterized protein n=1 Tax=Sphingomonas panacisoli TaxID=1813879 RepID=A0A5B8LIM3_9SPHN|nr:hypothetical protein [Sphingomonas panacisoli]QDZ07454.1 hypothetical protein FPZ24_08145 [Sphingomonas panacisoli]